MPKGQTQKGGSSAAHLADAIDRLTDMLDEIRDKQERYREVQIQMRADVDALIKTDERRKKLVDGLIVGMILSLFGTIVTLILTLLKVVFGL